MPQLKSKNFYDFLLKEGYLKKSPESLKRDYRNGISGIEEDILSRGLMKENELARAKSKYLKIPFISLRDVKISADILKEISQEAAQNYKFAPFEKKNRTLKVGVVNPEDAGVQEALNFIASKSGLNIELYIITRTDFRNVYDQYKSLRGEVEKALEELEKKIEEEQVMPRKRSIDEVKRVAAEAPITKMVAVMLKHATEGKASDIHIEPVEDRTRVRFRLDGVLYTSLLLPKHIHTAITSRIKVLSNLKLDESRIPQDGRFHATIDGKKIDFRVSTFPTAYGEKVAMRILDPSIGIMSFEALGLRDDSLDKFKKGISNPYGMILLTGPTGSGKTSTLYTALNGLNKEGINIVTLEDPVEYYIDGINQSQIRPDINYSFASGLRHILRQDPDIIMVGEIRDNETATLATHAALTGHLVFSTMHTNNAIGVIARLIDMGVEPFLIPSSLRLAVAQRLVRKLCVDCRKEVVPSGRIKEIIEEEISKLPESFSAKLDIKKPFKVYKSQGCSLCANKGTKGRIAIFEVFEMTPELQDIITKGMTETSLEQEAARQQMVTMKQDGILKALEGIVSVEEILRAVEE